MRLRRWAAVAATVVLAAFAASCARGATEATAAKHAWAKTVDAAGCPNLHMVNEGLYRGGQPTTEGFVALQKLGIKTVVNLCGGEVDEAGIKATGLKYVSLPVAHYDATEDEIVKFLTVATDKKTQPVFVHCTHGANRTGTMIAIYRVVIDGWTVEEALKELREGGYGASGGGAAFDEYMVKLDVKGIQKRLSEAGRNAAWATAIETAGCPNLFKVSDQLYRGAQPTAEGFKKLKEMGIKTVVSLRAFHSDRDELKGIDLDYVRIEMTPWHPEDEDLIKFIQIATDPKRTPVLVHCQMGADRTGTMVALYRVAVQGWSKEAAVEEMTKGGFGFHETWENLVEYLKKLNVDDIRKRAGMVKE